MKKNLRKLSLSFIIFSQFLINGFSQNAQNIEATFVKGNLQDKIACVKNASGEDSSKISLIAVDFVLQNISLLKDDRDLAGLAIASSFSFPEKEFLSNPENSIKKFETIFYNFKDKNVKSAILEKISLFAKIKTDTFTINFLNNFVQSAAENKVLPSEIEKKAISIISEIGNEKSFEILYQIYKNKIWTSLNNELQNSITLLSEKSTDQIFNIIKKADFAEMQQIYSIFVDNSKISSTLKSQIAENLLTNSMILVRDASKVSKEIAIFQLNNCKILFENSWTRSAPLMISYFEIAKSEFNANFLTTQEFSDVIKYVEKLASKNAVNLFVSYLEALNGKMNEGLVPEVDIVSALIQALGALGDKSAFDCLLYTTYLSYPEEIITQARNALSSLKW